MNEITNRDNQDQTDTQKSGEEIIPALETELQPQAEMPENSEPISENQERERVEKEIREWAKKTIQEWHDKVNPDYVFVTETAGIPYGYVLKEGWKNAYPDEEAPDFYRIDPKAIPPDESNEEKINEGLKKYFTKRIKKDNANIIVFDEGLNKPLQQHYAEGKDVLEDWSGGSLKSAAGDINYGIRDYSSKKGANIWIASGCPDNTGDDELLGGYTIDKLKDHGIRGRYVYHRPTSKMFGLRGGFFRRWEILFRR